jgi:hypothetical protein
VVRSRWRSFVLVAVLLVTGSAAASAAPATGQRWRPAQGTTWQWQLTGKLDLSIKAPVYDVDAYTTTKAQVATLHQRGRHVICYVDVGSWENWRPDAAAFPKSVLGASNGWPGERWLDIRKLGVLGPILTTRFQLCKDKGFDAVEPDNVDGYSNGTGFPLTAMDQLTFNRWLATSVHALGMSVALKNDVEQAAALEPMFDFSLDEQCVQYHECGSLMPFIKAGKAVLHVEYWLPLKVFCPKTEPLHFSSMRKKLDLGTWRRACPA